MKITPISFSINEKQDHKQTNFNGIFCDDNLHIIYDKFSQKKARKISTKLMLKGEQIMALKAFDEEPFVFISRARSLSDDMLEIHAAAELGSRKSGLASGIINTKSSAQKIANEIVRLLKVANANLINRNTSSTFSDNLAKLTEITINAKDKNETKRLLRIINKMEAKKEKPFVNDHLRICYINNEKIKRR